MFIIVPQDTNTYSMNSCSIGPNPLYQTLLHKKYIALSFICQIFQDSYTKCDDSMIVAFVFQ